MDNDLISRSALLEELSKIKTIGQEHPAHFLWRYAFACALKAVKKFPAVDAVEVGYCKGCMWENRKRPQKCSCCRRNPDMKDCYDERRTE